MTLRLVQVRWPGPRRRRSIRSAQALDELLEAFGWFEGGRCISVSPVPTVASTPRCVELVLRDGGVGGLRAGDLRTYKELRLEANGVQEWSLEGDAFVQVPGYLIGDLDLVEASDGFGFTLDLPTIVRLIATSFEWNRLPDVIEPFDAWASDRELFVNVPQGEAPAPGAWIDMLRRQGVEVGWRVYGGDITPPSRLPAVGYDGWFLERPERVGEHDGGVQIIIDSAAAGLTFTLGRRVEVVDDGLWLAVCRSTVGLFPDGEFMSGNSRFSGEEWLAHLSAAEATPEATVLNGIAVRSSYIREAHPTEVPKGTDPTGWRVRS